MTQSASSRKATTSRKRQPRLDILGNRCREVRLYLILGSNNKVNFSFLCLFRRLWYSPFKFKRDTSALSKYGRRRKRASIFQQYNSSAMILSDEGLTLETSAFESLYGGQSTLSTQLIKPNYPIF